MLYPLSYRGWERVRLPVTRAESLSGGWRRFG